MAGLGIPAHRAFWVGGTGGALLRGDAGFIATRIQQIRGRATAMQQELDDLTALLASDGAPRGDGVDVLRAGVGAARAAMGALGSDAASALADALRGTAAGSTPREAADPPAGEALPG
jgi:hypothetical protein